MVTLIQVPDRPYVVRYFARIVLIPPIVSLAALVALFVPYQVCAARGAR